MLKPMIALSRLLVAVLVLLIVSANAKPFDDAILTIRNYTTYPDQFELSPTVAANAGEGECAVYYPATDTYDSTGYWANTYAWADWWCPEAFGSVNEATGDQYVVPPQIVSDAQSTDLIEGFIVGHSNYVQGCIPGSGSGNTWDFSWQCAFYYPY